MRANAWLYHDLRKAEDKGSIPSTAPPALYGGDAFSKPGAVPYSFI